MLRSILTKTIYDKRWSTLIWMIALAVTCIFVAVMFPTFKDSFGEALKDTPESLRSLLGDASDYQTINGYVDIQVVNQMVFLTLIMGIILGTSLLSGEESDGRLQTLLAQPVSRSLVYWYKFTAMSLLILLATSGMFFGTVLGSLFVGEFGSLAIGRLLQATIMTWLVTLVFGALAFMVGGITGRKGISGIVAGFVAFGTFLITTLAGTATVLDSINSLSPFKYFNTPSIIKTGLDTGNVLVLISIVVVLALAGWAWFVRRDVYQR